MRSKQAINFFFFLFTGILLLCQQHYCDELSTSSLASSTGEAVTVLTSTTTTVSPPTNSSVVHVLPLPKTSIISTSTTHTTRLQRISETKSDEALIELTTTVDGLCQPKGHDADDTTGENYSIKSIGGDIIVTVLLPQADNASEIIRFIVNHINEIDLLIHNVTIGERFACDTSTLLKFNLFKNFRRRSHCPGRPAEGPKGDSRERN